MIYSREQKLVVFSTGVVVGYLGWCHRCRMLRKMRQRRGINLALTMIIPKRNICIKQLVSRQKLYYTKSGLKTDWFSTLYKNSTEGSFQTMLRFDKAEFNNLVSGVDEHLNSQFSVIVPLETRLNRRVLSNREVVALTLLRLTGPLKIARLAYLFGIGLCIAHKYIIHCVLGICNVLRNEIRWPQQQQRYVLKARLQSCMEEPLLVSLEQ